MGSDATRRRIVDAAYTLFYRQGFARVGVDRIAEKAKVSKRTLYNHFPSKDVLLATVLELQGVLALERLDRWAVGTSGDLAQTIDSLFSGLAAWAARPRWQGAGFTRVVMELADMPGHPARRIAGRHKAAVEARLATLMGRHGVARPDEAARQLCLLLEGSMALMLVHGDAAYAAAA
ncbi:MAG: TetR/AcrR family transcriptional regulator, partial [Alphaproteobacteria bacterium]|nr:TetR/AcrR family transcriptional regulator [Alphaproteobacteria bacterium]